MSCKLGIISAIYSDSLISSSPESLLSYPLLFLQKIKAAEDANNFIRNNIVQGTYTEGSPKLSEYLSRDRTVHFQVTLNQSTLETVQSCAPLSNLKNPCLKHDLSLSRSRAQIAEGPAVEQRDWANQQNSNQMKIRNWGSSGDHRCQSTICVRTLRIFMQSDGGSLFKRVSLGSHLKESL